MITKLLSFGLPKVMGTLGLGKIQLIVLGVLLLALGGQAVAIRFLWSQRDGLIAQAAAEKVAHESTKAVFVAYKENAERQAEQTGRAVSDLAVSHYKAQDEINTLRNKLRKHDLGELARAKPGLIQNRVNAATKKLFNRISLRQVWEPNPYGMFPFTDPWRSDYEKTLRYITRIDMGNPCWLFYASGRKADGVAARCLASGYLPSAGKAQSGTAAVRSFRGGAPGILRRDHRKEQGPILHAT